MHTKNIDTVLLGIDGYSNIGLNSSYYSNNTGVFSDPPKVIKEPPLTIDQMCTAALSRLRVAVQANADWELVKFHRRCRNYELKYRIQNTVFTDTANTSKILANARGFTISPDKYIKVVDKE